MFNFTDTKKGYCNIAIVKVFASIDADRNHVAAHGRGAAKGEIDTADFTTVFVRYEKKYIVTADQRDMLLAALADFTVPDEHGESEICNVYYDTPDFDIVRRSIEKPAYKEKLRLRSYGVPGPDDTVFAELKKKYDGIVFKRRVAMSAQQAEALFAGRPCAAAGQIADELRRAVEFYRPLPRVWLGYRRVALYGREDPNLRITFDSGLRWRTEALSLTAGDFGRQVDAADPVIMEVKTAGALPVRLCRLLSCNGVYPDSFSKYGRCYSQYIIDKISQEVKQNVG